VCLASTGSLGRYRSPCPADASISAGRPGSLAYHLRTGLVADGLANAVAAPILHWA
jgi:hypothetical protein